MKRSITWLCVVIFLSIGDHSIAQKPRNQYQLLWKISGNGLKKPSYLFGTMHLRDKRVFDFSDSVLVKLEECQAFAMEVTPDSMLAEVFSLLMEEEEENNEEGLDEKLSDEEYNELSEKLKVEGIDIEKVKNKSPRKILKLLANPIARKEDKETFLDAYLYRIAKGNNKTIVGLEKIKEHMGTLKSSYEEEIKDLKSFIKYQSSHQTQSLIDIYWEGDLSKIENFYANADSTYLENLLYKRNEKMRDKMMELMKEQTTFTAVGAGHLPGEKGLVELLRKKGYTVSPVKATFTGVAGKYKEKPLITDWVRFNVDEHLYSAEFPSQPFLYSGNSVYSTASKIYIYPDLATGIFYYSISFPMAKTADGSADALIDQYLKSLDQRPDYKLISRKKIIYQGNQGAEAVFQNSSNELHLKLQLTIRKSSLYILMIGGYNEKILASKDAERFFASLELKDYINSSWQSFKSEEGAFSINTPFELKKTETTIPNEMGKIEIKMFLATDQSKGITYYIAYYNLSPGTVLTDDSLYLNSSLQNMASRSKGEIQESEDLMIDNFPGKAFVISAVNEAYTKGWLLIRGSRPYVVFVVTSKDKLHSPDVHDFISSFKFIDFKSAKWETYNSPKFNFSVSVPSKVKVEVDSSDRDHYTENFNSIDKHSGTSYIVSVEKFGRYEFMEKEKFYKDKPKEFIGDDSLIWEKEVMIDGIKGKEMLVQLKTTHNHKRLLILPKDDYLYHLLCFLPQQYSKDEAVEKFFTSFKFTTPSADASIFTSKAKQLLTDLSSSDSSIFATAKSMLYGYDFQKEDLPLIYEKIKIPLPDDTLEYWNVKTMLIGKLEKLHDQTTVSFIKEFYQLPDTNAMIKIRILEPLLHIGTDEAINSFAELTKKQIPDTDFQPYAFFSPLKDSLELNKKVYPKIIHLFHHKNFRNGILDLGTQLIDSNAISLSFFDPYKKEFMEIAMENLASQFEEDFENDYSYYSNNTESIDLLSRINQDTSIASYLKAASFSPHLDVRLAAIKGQLRNKYPIENKNLEKIAATNSLRVDLYNALKEMDKTSIYPAKWLTQTAFAESSLYNYLTSYEDYPPSKIVVLGNKIRMYKGEEKKFYLLKFTIYENEWYTALVGPYSLDKKEINSVPELITTEYDEVKSKSINEHFNTLFKEE